MVPEVLALPAQYPKKLFFPSPELFDHPASFPIKILWELVDEWPLTNPKSNYVIHEGNPKTFGRIDSSTQTTRVGIWKCTHGKLECTEQGDEFFTILKGSVEITYVDDPKQTMTLSTGDSMFISANGRRVIWNILDDDVTKVFYGCKMDGY